MIWLVGARGMLGTEVAGALSARGVPHTSTDLETDITDLGALRRAAATRPASVLINCSGYTAVDRAEDEVGRARAINAFGAENLGTLAAEMGARVVHVSTDYVFDGTKGAPYREDDPVNPQGAYGRSKAEGEALLLAACPRSFVVRTAWLYGHHGNNFVDTMLRLFASRDEVGVIDDQHGTPTHAGDLAEALVTIAKSSSTAFGTYHYTNDGQVTWYGFAERIYERARARGLLSRACALRRLTTAEYPTKARRPSWSVLDLTKIRSTFGLAIRPWESALEAYLDGSPPPAATGAD
jgi:dTDP-4-dehydrorhamnose reductase